SDVLAQARRRELAATLGEGAASAGGLDLRPTLLALEQVRVEPSTLALAHLALDVAGSVPRGLVGSSSERHGPDPSSRSSSVTCPPGMTPNAFRPRCRRDRIVPRGTPRTRAASFVDIPPRSTRASARR